jgi:hypothetical protein
VQLLDNLGEVHKVTALKVHLRRNQRSGFSNTADMQPHFAETQVCLEPQPIVLGVLEGFQCGLVKRLPRDVNKPHIAITERKREPSTCRMSIFGHEDSLSSIELMDLSLWFRDTAPFMYLSIWRRIAAVRRNNQR